MSLPTMFGFVAQTLYEIVDMIWIGRISKEAVAAVTIVTSIFWLIWVLNDIIGASSVSLISQSYGSGSKKRTSRVIEQTLTFKGLVALIAASLLLVLIKPLLHFFTDSQEVVRAALDYGYLRIFFLPIAFSSVTVNTALRCIGDSKKPMYIMLFSSVLNIVLDPVLMFERIPLLGWPGFNLGVFGAALATSISMTAAFLLGMWFLFSGRSYVKPSLRGLLRLDREIDRKLITIGLPSGMEMLSRNLAGLVTLKFVAMYSTTAVATMGVGNRLFAFAFMPTVGLLSGGGTIVGQNLGAGKVERAEQTARTASVLGVLIMSVFGAVALLFPRQIIRVFIADPAVIETGVSMLRIITPGLVAAGAFMGFACVFSGSGYNLPFLVGSVASRWGAQVPVLALGAWLGLPIVIVWISFLASDLIELLVLYSFYRRGKWKSVRVVGLGEDSLQN